MKKSLFSFLLILAVGCGDGEQDAKKDSKQAPAKPTMATVTSPVTGPEGPPPPNPETPQPAATPVATQGISADTVDEEGNNVRLTFLNEALRSYVKDNETMPRGFGDMIKAGYLQREPVPPEGKKYVIDEKTRSVQIVNN